MNIYEANIPCNAEFSKCVYVNMYQKFFFFQKMMIYVFVLLFATFPSSYDNALARTRDKSDYVWSFKI